MRTEQFEEVINNRIETCKSVLCSKAEEDVYKRQILPCAI